MAGGGGGGAMRSEHPNRSAEGHRLERSDPPKAAEGAGHSPHQKRMQSVRGCMRTVCNRFFLSLGEAERSTWGIGGDRIGGDQCRQAGTAKAR